MQKYFVFKFIFFATLFITEGHTFSNQMILRGGGLLAFNKIKAYDNTSTIYSAGGLKSNVGYRFTKWEFSILSNIFYGSTEEEIVLKSSTTTVRGKGNVRSVSFGPYAKYITDISFASTWGLYFGAGPTWSQQTVKFRDFRVTNGMFTSHHRLSARSFGFNFAVGIEEMLKFKEMHPVFFEIGYSYHEANKISVLDAANTREIETLSIEDTNQRMFSHTLIISTGMIIF